MPSPLLDLIRSRIRDEGPLTVADYIDLALYHPDLGYYARTHQRSGRQGDFITSVDLGPVFGELLAEQFAEMWEVLGGEVPFDLVEAAAGNGRLSRDILDHAATAAPRFAAALRLHLVERSARARERQAEVLGPHAALLVESSGAVPEGVRGVIFANELLDALPPHLVAMRRDGLREVFVDADGGRLVTREGRPSTPRLAEYLERVGARLEPGWQAEVNLAAVDWMGTAASRLERGFLVVIDYGHEANELFSGTRAGGTLTTFRQHASEAREEGAGWLAEPGERDITSHVDLTSVGRAAIDAGLDPIGRLDQGYFLLGLGLASPNRVAEGQSAREVQRRLALKTLFMPGGLGSTHKVLIFGRGVGQPQLKGLSFAHRLT